MLRKIHNVFALIFSLSYTLAGFEPGSLALRAETMTTAAFVYPWFL
jgi:hypothetical protein